MKSSSLLTLALFVAILPATAQSTPDKAAVEAVVQGLATAWNAHDAKAFSAHFAADGTFTNIVGENTFGYKQFLEDHEHIFATIYKDSSVHYEISRTKFLTPEVALVDVDSHLSGFTRLPPGIKPEADGRFHCKILMVLHKEKGQWWIVGFHNVGVVQLPPHP